MMNYITANTIKTLREKKRYTQKDLADILTVSDKTVSKWETGRGLPDITMLEPLAKALGVSLAELLSGECVSNKNRSGNMLKACFYVCPVCGNVINSIGDGCYSCCGITLPKLEVEEIDESHEINVEKIDNEYYVTVNHPMTREHYISFLAFVTTERVEIIKMYPEQNAEARFPIKGRGKIYAFCNKHGLFEKIIK